MPKPSPFPLFIVESDVEGLKEALDYETVTQAHKTVKLLVISETFDSSNAVGILYKGRPPAKDKLPQMLYDWLLTEEGTHWMPDPVYDLEAVRAIVNGKDLYWNDAIQGYFPRLEV